jgi:hypothetical protein
MHSTESHDVTMTAFTNAVTTLGHIECEQLAEFLTSEKTGNDNRHKPDKLRTPYK